LIDTKKTHSLPQPRNWSHNYAYGSYRGFEQLGKLLKLADYLPENSSHNKVDWREGFREYLEEEERSYNTITSYLSDLNIFVKWFDKTQGNFAPNLITALDLRDYKRDLLLKSKPSTINRKLSAISTFLIFARDAGLIHSIPKIPKQVKEQHPGIRWLNRPEQHSLLRRVERYGNDRDLGTIKVLLNTGLRVSELADLLWSEVEISDRKGSLIVRSGKGSKRRTIPLNKDARSGFLLLDYDSNQGTDKPVMVGQRGRLTRRGIEHMVEKYRGDLDGFSCHSLRHTFCKNLVDGGIGLEKVAALAGHESLETTRRYCQPSYHDLEKAVQVIGEEED
jgi:integrase/recombinase XerC